MISADCETRVGSRSLHQPQYPVICTAKLNGLETSPFHYQKNSTTTKTSTNRLNNSSTPKMHWVITPLLHTPGYQNLKNCHQQCHRIQSSSTQKGKIEACWKKCNREENITTQRSWFLEAPHTQPPPPPSSRAAPPSTPSINSSFSKQSPLNYQPCFYNYRFGFSQP